MQVKQIYEIVNTITEEITGESGLVLEDLSNIVSVGSIIFNATSVDNYVKKLVDRIGRTVFVNRPYESTAPKIARDSWEYGSVLQKVRCELPDAVENKTWSLVKGQSVDPFVFSPPDVTVKYFNNKTTFEVDMSFTDRQVKESFINADEMNRFFSMIENRIRTKLTLDKDALIMRTIVNLIAEKIASGSNVVNLLSIYNTTHGTSLTPMQAINNADFLRHSCGVIKLYTERLKRPSTLYNNHGYVTHTPKEYQHLVLLSEYATALDVQLYSTSYHNEFLEMPKFETTPMWQATGTGVTADRFEVTSAINAKTASDGTTVNSIGIIGVLFDRDACMVCNDNPRVTSQYNGKGEYTNFFYKEDCSYFNDLAENVVVFTVGPANHS